MVQFRLRNEDSVSTRADNKEKKLGLERYRVAAFKR